MKNKTRESNDQLDQRADVTMEGDCRRYVPDSFFIQLLGAAHHVNIFYDHAMCHDDTHSSLEFL